MAVKEGPQAMFGDLLWGDRAVRFVFFDEAGTSEREPVTVIVGLIVNADKQLLFAEQAVAEVLAAVPKKYQEGFVFHATEVWSSPKYRDEWTMADRLSVIRAMIALPRKLQIPVSMGMIRRNSDMGIASERDAGSIIIAGEPIPGLTKAQMQHVIAFQATIAAADRYIRNYADAGEVATVVAEDVREMRRFLEDAPRRFRENPVNLGNRVIPAQKEIVQGYVEQSTDFRVSRIRKNVHFVKKGSDSLLQVADACAFAFRRYFSRQKFGKEFVELIVGYPLIDSDYDGPCSFCNYYDHPRTI